MVGYMVKMVISAYCRVCQADSKIRYCFFTRATCRTKLAPVVLIYGILRSSVAQCHISTSTAIHDISRHSACIAFASMCGLPTRDEGSSLHYQHCTTPRLSHLSQVGLVRQSLNGLLGNHSSGADVRKIARYKFKGALAFWMRSTLRESKYG